jgi:hypothetical protein
MSKKPVPNPDYMPWTIQGQSSFISEAFSYYSKQHGNPTHAFNPRTYYDWRKKEDVPIDAYGGGHQTRLDTLIWLYRLGHETGVLALSYAEFQKAILWGGQHPAVRGGYNRYTRRWTYNEDYDFWYPIKGAHFREKVGGPKKALHRDRTPEELEARRQEQEWREKKGFQRSRNQDQNWRRGCGARTFHRKLGNRCLRRWEKREISKERWEALADENRIMRLYLDPWDYD